MEKLEIIYSFPLHSRMGEKSVFMPFGNVSSNFWIVHRTREGLEGRKKGKVAFMIPNFNKTFFNYLETEFELIKTLIKNFLFSNILAFDVNHHFLYQNRIFHSEAPRTNFAPKTFPQQKKKSRTYETGHPEKKASIPLLPTPSK